MASTARLGTPLLQQRSSSSNAGQPNEQSPSTSTATQFTSGLMKGSPIKLNRGIVSTLNDNTTSTQSPTPSIAGAQLASRDTNNASELKDEIQRLRARTRIIADPSISTSFKREEDKELYDLFLS
ncbi:hypothetical protein OIO90_002720 [Microbotryomycetes sp. JL221]|nr:hypothetical protein OIO90_002720 [Microbotryomycetes sp. JL221]